MRTKRTACAKDRDFEAKFALQKMQIEVVNPENVEIDAEVSIDSNSQIDSMIDGSGFRENEKSEKQSSAT